MYLQDVDCSIDCNRNCYKLDQRAIIEESERLLFGNRISQAIAADTWRLIVEVHGRDTPTRLCECTHAELVKILGEGGYRRYDESTATRLQRLCRTLVDDYDGRILGIAEAAGSREEFESRLLEFRGVGPVTLAIFMREAGPAVFGQA